MAHLYFVMKQPEQPDRILIWDTRTLSIGRAPENDLTLEDDEVSRKHAVLSHENGAFQVGDYRTGNGTFVNGERVAQKKAFQPGDVLAIGKLQMEFRQSDAHPAKLGLKAEFASQLKTMAMMPGLEGDGDSNATVLGLEDEADSKAFADEFVVEPERGSGGVAFVVGAEGDDQFQMRELDESLNDMEFELEADGSMSLDDVVDPPPATRPLALELDETERTGPPADAPSGTDPAQPAAPAAPGADPTERLRKLKLLHDEGLITEEEFQAKRSQILSEM